MLEDAIEGRLHKTVWLRNGEVSFSVSGVNAALSDCFVGFWLLVALYVNWKYLGWPSLDWPALASLPSVYAAIVGALTFIGFWYLWCKKTDLWGTIPHADGSHGTPFVHVAGAVGAE